MKREAYCFLQHMLEVSAIRLHACTKTLAPVKVVNCIVNDALVDVTPHLVASFLGTQCSTAFTGYIKQDFTIVCYSKFANNLYATCLHFTVYFNLTVCLIISHQASAHDWHVNLSCLQKADEGDAVNTCWLRPFWRMKTINVKSTITLRTSQQIRLHIVSD